MSTWDPQVLMGEKKWLAERDEEEVVQEKLNPDFRERTDGC